jgi:ABC-type multidrug transport system ATPase subunit/pSer/pThr/pTyr-binding forkhead associated (FHA) protein
MSQISLKYAGRSKVFTEDQVVTIGRSLDATFQIEDSSISRIHATLAYDESQKSWVFTDSKSANGCFVKGVRINSILISGPVDIHLGETPLSVVISLDLSHEAPKTAVSGSVLAATDVVIGKASDANFIVTDVLASRRHARLITLENALILEDLGSTNGTFLNGKLIRTAPVREGDIITIGNTDLTIRNSHLDFLRSQSEKSGGLYANNLEFEIKGGRKLLSGIDVRLAPGSLTAVIGPSGAGKSTFLKAIAGVNKPTGGTVTFDGFNVYKNFDVVSSRIGMVPQDDVLHTTLKLDTALNYAARLRLRVDGGKAERTAQVNKVIERLELDSNRDTVINKLSGGQRKRASVALELLTEPSLLILDEPTSGLDPAMDRQVMKTLRELAVDDRAVLVVTHSVAQLDLCDDVLVLAPGGMPAYYGPPRGISAYFGTTDWADIFALIKEDPNSSYQRYLAQNPKAVVPAPEVAVQSMSSKRVSAPWLSQFITMCARQVSLVFADLGYLMFLLLLPVIVGLLILVVPGASGLGAASNSSPAEPSQLLAMLVIGSAFMGASVSIRDLVGERPIYLRERAVGLSISAYLGSKLLVFGLFSWFMAGMLTYVTLLAKPAPIQAVYFDSPALELFMALGLTAMASLVTGLLLSALVKSSEQVMPLFVVFIMAQLVLNGGLLQITAGGLVDALSVLVIARWGFAMAASSVNLAAISPSLDEDPLWVHDLATWANSAAFLIATAVIIITLTRIRLEGKYDR